MQESQFNLDAPQNLKYCFDCKSEVQRSQFYKNNNKKDGLHDSCKPCHKRRSRKQRLLHPDTALRYRKSPFGKFVEYKGTAKEKGLEFAISFDDFKKFWQVPCYYCGGLIETIGLDRVDSGIGYKITNIVPCCKACNISKNDRTQKAFLEHCLKIVRHCELS
jgi:hypothetical protein